MANSDREFDARNSATYTPGGMAPLNGIAGTPVGTESAVSGLKVTGNERNAAKEQEALDIGYSQAYIASRGGINSQGYFNDTPISGQLTSAEQKQVRLPNGNTDTIAMAKILQQKQYDDLISQGVFPSSAAKQLAGQWGTMFDSSIGGGILQNTGGFDSKGNPTFGGEYNSSGTYVGGGSSTAGGGTSGGNLQTGTSTSGTSIPGTTQADEIRRTGVTTALEDFKANLKLAGLDSLASVIDDYIKQDLTASQIKINLVGTQAYKDRFPGMAALSKAGKAISEAAYISTERAYDTTLRAHGLDASIFGTTAKYGDYIGKGIAPTEFENRIAIAADRVNKNSDVLAALNNYYGVSKTGALAYLLDPTLGMDIVQREARAAEIGAAAANAKFSFGAGEVGAGVAESFINAAGTEDLQTLKAEFSKARTLADTQSRLSAIEGENYQDLEAVSAQLGQNRESILKSQRRAAREVARFAGQSGVSSSSLKRESTI